MGFTYRRVTRTIRPARLGREVASGDATFPMTDNVEPGHEPETAAADLNAILAEDQSSPAPQAEQPAEAPKAEAQADPEVKPEAPKQDAEQNHPFWYRKRLKEIEQRAKEAERRAKELEERQSQPQVQMPDPRQDPASYYETMRIMDRLERSEDRFIDKHGEQTLEEVREWMASMPEAQRDAFEAFCQQQRHPWQTAHEHYQRAKMAAEIGDDPAAWRQRQEKEIEERILERLAAEGRLAATGMTARPNIPAPASGQRSAAPRNGPGFAGPTPIGNILGG